MTRILQIFVLLIILSSSTVLSGCATAARGASTEFKVDAKQDGVSVLFDLETNESRREHDWRDRRDAVHAGAQTPNFTYFECDTLPCTLNVPRKFPFTVLAYKEGYIPQIFQVVQVHKSKIDDVTKAGLVLGTGATIGGFGLGLSSAAGTTFNIAGSMAGLQVMVIAFPITFALAGANEVDKETMANYDLYPNPIDIDLQPLAEGTSTTPLDEVIKAYNIHRVKASLDPKKTGMCYYKNTRMSCWQLKKLEKRLEKDK